MKTIRFKSSLKCNGCVNAIKPGMDSIDAIKKWRVFLDVQEKIFEVEVEEDEEKVTQEIKNAVTKAGYKIDKIED